MQNWDSQSPNDGDHAAFLERGLKHLAQDRVMAELIESYPPPEPRTQNDLFIELIDAIVSQQLSVKAAAAIYGRLERHFDGSGITPRGLVDASQDDLRALGLSWSKIRYMQGIGRAILDGEFDPAALESMSDEDAAAELVKLKGVGPWTAEIILMFALGRPDIFSVGDLGLRAAVALHYGVERDNYDEVLAVAAGWSPYRSLACHYLWKSLDNKPLE